MGDLVEEGLESGVTVGLFVSKSLTTLNAVKLLAGCKGIVTGVSSSPPKKIVT